MNSSTGYEIISEESLLTTIKVDQSRFSIYMVKLGDSRFEYRVTSDNVGEVLVHESSNFAANLNESDPNLEQQQYEVLTQAVSSLIDLLTSLYPEQEGLERVLNTFTKSGDDHLLEEIRKQLPITRSGRVIVGLPLAGKSTLQSFIASRSDRVVTQSNEISLLYPPSWQSREITVWLINQMYNFKKFNEVNYENLLKYKTLNINDLNLINNYLENTDYFSHRPQFTKEEIQEATVLKVRLSNEKDRIFIENSDAASKVDKSMRPSDIALKDFKMQLLRIRRSVEFFKLATRSGFEPLLVGYFVQTMSILCGQLKIFMGAPTSKRVEKKIGDLLTLSQLLPYQPEGFIYLDIDLEVQEERFKVENPSDKQRRALTYPLSVYYKSFYEYVIKGGFFNISSIKSPDDPTVKGYIEELSLKPKISFNNIIEFLMGLIDLYQEEWIYYLSMLSPSLIQRLIKNFELRKILEEDLALQEEVYFTFFGIYDIDQIYERIKGSESRLALGDPECLDEIKKLFKNRGSDFLSFLIHRKKFIFELECLIKFRKEIESILQKEH